MLQSSIVQWFKLKRREWLKRPIIAIKWQSYCFWCYTLSVYPHRAGWKVSLTTVGIEPAIYTQSNIKNIIYSPEYITSKHTQKISWQSYVFKSHECFQASFLRRGFSWLCMIAISFEIHFTIGGSWNTSGLSRLQRSRWFHLNTNRNNSKLKPLRTRRELPNRFFVCYR